MNARKILVAIKSLEQVNELMSLACGISTKPELIVAHVIELPAITPLDAPIPNADDEAEEIRKSAEAEAQRCGAQCTVRLLRARDAGDALLDEMRQHAVDLAVLGHTHRSKVAEALMGSTSEKLAERAPCHVLISIPPRGHAAKERELFERPMPTGRDDAPQPRA